MAAWFTEIIIVEGNHDDRIARKTGGEVYLGMFLRDAKFVRYSRYSYLYMRTSQRGLIKLVHPENFSSTPVALGQQFYDVERGPRFDPFNPFKTAEKCHFVLAHTHIDQSGYSKDGVYEVHAMGTCRDATRTQYKNKGQNKHHQWSQDQWAQCLKRSNLLVADADALQLQGQEALEYRAGHALQSPD